MSSLAWVLILGAAWLAGESGGRGPGGEMDAGLRGERVRVLSLGAGVQSTTLLHMAMLGEIPPFDAVIAADTQWERAVTYTHLQKLVTAYSDDVPMYSVTAGDIRAESLSKAGRFASMPAFVLKQNGEKGQLRRQCTNEYKLRPIKRQVRELGATAKNPAERVIGISWDEWTRCRDSDVQYIRNVFPLIEMRVTRQDCIAWLVAHGFEVPAKSACVGCPYRTREEWNALTQEERADANDFDDRLRDTLVSRKPGQFQHLRGPVFLHPSLKPLAVLDFRSEQERGQMEMWDGEVSGGCMGGLCNT